MFKKMHDEITEQNKQWSVERIKAKALRNHFRERRRQHKAGAQGNERGKKRPAPCARAYNGAAKDVGEAGSYAEYEADPKVGHGECQWQRGAVYRSSRSRGLDQPKLLKYGTKVPPIRLNHRGKRRTNRPGVHAAEVH